MEKKLCNATYGPLLCIHDFVKNIVCYKTNLQIYFVDVVGQ